MSTGRSTPTSPAAQRPAVASGVVEPPASAAPATPVASAPNAAPRFPLTLGQLQVSPIAGAARAVLRPQKHLQQAQAARVQATRHGSPVGLGLDSVNVRQRMVQRLRVAGIDDERVLQAFQRVPRHAFVDSALVGQAYEDTSLPIGLSQTISKPSVVARMLLLLMQGGTARDTGNLGRVLEIGTGCGYQAALLCLLGTQVVSIERLLGLHQRAQINLQVMPPYPLRLVHGDGRLGDTAGAPFDTIIAAAGGENIPDPWLTQLAPGGRLVAPLTQVGQSNQVLVVVDHKANGNLVTQHHEFVKFVPLKSGIE